MSRTLILLVFVIVAASCSLRVEYELPQPQRAPEAININTATVDELETLPHVGPKMAEAIVDHREQHGAFRRVEHLMLIRGVSEARFAKIKTIVRVE